jgi:hypothetical protein
VETSFWVFLLLFNISKQNLEKIQTLCLMPSNQIFMIEAEKSANIELYCSVGIFEKILRKN